MLYVKFKITQTDQGQTYTSKPAVLPTVSALVRAISLSVCFLFVVRWILMPLSTPQCYKLILCLHSLVVSQKFVVSLSSEYYCSTAG